MSNSRILTVWQTSALQCLEHAARRDLEKGGIGCRNTGEIAEYVGISTEHARNTLHRLAYDNLVDGFDSTPIEWRITDAGKAALSASRAS